MTNKPYIAWMLAALVVWLGAFFVPAFAATEPGRFDWRWAVPYALLEAILVGMQMRLRPSMHPALGRLLALLAGVAALLLALALGHAGRVPQLPFFSGLVGLAAVALLARIAPSPLARLWFGGSGGREMT